MYIERYNHFKHRKHLISALYETWNLHEGFPQAKNITVIYSLFLSMALLSSCQNYVVIVQGRPMGFLAGMIKSKNTLAHKIKQLLPLMGFGLHAWWVIITRQLGKPKAVRKYLKELRQLDTQLSTDKILHDASIELFYLHPDARGQGAGKALLDHYVTYCQQLGVRSIVLWTDIHCSYTFYDSYGFKRQSAMYSPLLGEEKKDNAFVYAYTLPNS